MSTTRGGAARLDDLGGKGGGGDDELDGEWQWPKTSLGKKISSLELSLRCLICSNYLNNPHSLSCGHSYCSECIRKHLDKSYNPTPSSGYCPTCREIANPSQLRVSKDLINVISLYQELRNELLVFLTTATTPNLTKQSQSYDETNTDHDHHINNPNIRSNSKKTHEITRLPAKLFHIETKEKVRKALEKLTENCSTKIRLDGDKETLVKRYTEFVHINNAQLSAKNPLSLSEIVHEVHRRERALEFHNSMSKKSNLIVEKLKAGQETKEVKAGFSELIKRARESKLKTQSSNSESSAVPVDNSSMKDEIQSSQGSAADADILEQGDWIIIQSKKFQRPFFFNIRNESGQFRIPPELIDTIQTIGVPSSVGGSDITPNPDKPTSTQSIRKSTRNSAPAKLEVEHVLGDDSSGEDSSYTPSSSSKGVKRSRSGRSLRSRDLEIKTQHQLAQANLTNLTQNEKYIEIHEVEDNDDLDGEINNYVACHQCTYHNPPGSIRCEICTTKLQSTPNSSMDSRKSVPSSNSKNSSTTILKKSPTPPNKNMKKSPRRERGVGRNMILVAYLLVGFSTLTLSIYLYSYLTRPKLKYDGVHVLVTGGSSGIGYDIAKEYLQRGANVTIVARNLQKLENSLIELKKLIKNKQQQIRIIAVDVSSNEETVKKAFQPIVSELGPVEVLINCAGTSIAGEFSSISVEEFSRMININLFGSIYPTRAVVEGMKMLKRGRIVFVSSQIAQIAIYGYTAYAASKWALRGLAEALQMELRPYNIYVSLAYPPDTDTPGYEIEMQTKPEITKKLSESGTLFSSKDVAFNIVEYSDRGYYGISTGTDGWMLKYLHPGMSPVNNIWEVWSGMFMTPIFRLISIGYLLYFDSIVKSLSKNPPSSQPGKKTNKTE